MPPHTVGEICGRGPMVMLGYWKQPELTAHTLRNGWLHTGDGGYLDEEGFLYVVDRHEGHDRQRRRRTSTPRKSRKRFTPIRPSPNAP